MRFEWPINQLVVTSYTYSYIYVRRKGRYSQFRPEYKFAVKFTSLRGAERQIEKAEIKFPSLSTFPRSVTFFSAAGKSPRGNNYSSCSLIQVLPGGRYIFHAETNALFVMEIAFASLFSQLCRNSFKSSYKMMRVIRTLD